MKRVSPNGNRFLFFQGGTLQYLPTSRRKKKLFCFFPQAEKRNKKISKVFSWFYFPHKRFFSFPQTRWWVLAPNIFSFFFPTYRAVKKKTVPTYLFLRITQKNYVPAWKNQNQLPLFHHMNYCGTKQFFPFFFSSKSRGRPKAKLDDPLPGLLGFVFWCSTRPWYYYYRWVKSGPGHPSRNCTLSMVFLAFVKWVFWLFVHSCSVTFINIFCFFRLKTLQIELYDATVNLIEILKK